MLQNSAHPIAQGAECRANDSVREGVDSYWLYKSCDRQLVIPLSRILLNDIMYTTALLMNEFLHRLSLVNLPIRYRSRLLWNCGTSISAAKHGRSFNITTKGLVKSFKWNTVGR